LVSGLFFRYVYPDPHQSIPAPFYPLHLSGPITATVQIPVLLRTLPPIRGRSDINDFIGDVAITIYFDGYVFVFHVVFVCTVHNLEPYDTVSQLLIADLFPFLANFRLARFCDAGAVNSGFFVSPESPEYTSRLAESSLTPER
jgi:hypothetical protein